MPDFRPFSYGNAIAAAEGIVGQRNRNALARHRLDPNSTENQLRQAALERAQFQYSDPELIGDTGIYGQRGPQGQIATTFQQPTRAKAPDKQRLYEYAKTLEGGNYEGSMEDFLGLLRGKGITVNTGMPEFKPPTGYMHNPEYGDDDKRLVIPIPGSRHDEKAGELPASQTLAAGFADRMIASNGMLENIVSSGFDPSSGFEAAMDAGGAIGNYGKSAGGQLYANARENWVTANLRKESGAVIGVEEMEKEVKKYFPMPGDGAEVIEQKKYLRAVATQGMINQAQKAYKGAPFEMPEPPGGVVPEIKSQEEYDALQSGDEFIEDGVRYRKP